MTSLPKSSHTFPQIVAQGVQFSNLHACGPVISLYVAPGVIEPLIALPTMPDLSAYHSNTCVDVTKTKAESADKVSYTRK